MVLKPTADRVLGLASLLMGRLVTIRQATRGQQWSLSLMQALALCDQYARFRRPDRNHGRPLSPFDDDLCSMVPS